MSNGNTRTPPAPDDSQFVYNKTGKATNFGGTPYKKDPIDPGVGAPALGTGKKGISTANSYGVAVPFDQMEKQFGADKSNWPDMRTARADVTNNDTGETVRMPIVDFGPGPGPLSRGVVTDLTKQTQTAWGAASPANVTIKVVPNAGPDYAKDTDGWYAEQQKIHGQLTTKTGLPGIGAEPATTSWASPAGINAPPVKQPSQGQTEPLNLSDAGEGTEPLDNAYRFPP